MKKTHLLLSVMLIFVFAFSSIIKAESSITLRFWIHQHPPEVQYIQNVLMPEFKKTHPNVNIEFSYFPGKDYVEKLMVANATGTSPDCFDLGDYYYPGFIAKKLLAPVDPNAFGYKTTAALEKTYLKGSLSGMKFKNQLYGIPIQQNSFSLLINTKLFKEAGLDPQKDYPKTWAEMVRVAQKLVKYNKDGRMIQEGFDLPYNGPYWAMFTFDPLIRQYGGSVLTSDGKKAALNSKAGVAALTMWQDLLYKHKVGDANITTATAAVPNEDFTEGKVAMWTTGPWALDQVKVNPEVYQNTIVVPYPQANPAKPATMQYGFSWSVSSGIKDSKVKKAAWDWIAMASSRPTDWLLKLGFPQPKLDWYKSKEAQSFPFLDVWMSDLSQANFLPRSEYYDEISASVDRAIQRCMFAKMDPKQSLDIAAKEINKILSGN